jgi:xanthine dehydrogenase accessory factor
MAVSDIGEMIGSVSGGCVESAVVEEALQVLASGRPRLLEYSVPDERAWDVGLTCGGQVQIFVEPLPRDPDAIDRVPTALASMGRRLAQGQPIVRTVVIRGPEETVGQAAVFAPEGKLEGGGIPAVSESLPAEALSVLGSGFPRRRVFPLAGGELEVFFDLMQPAPTLVLVGGVHIAIVLTRLAKVLGFSVVIVDPRRSFATPERFPEADRLVRQWPDEGLRSVGLTPTTAVAVLSHDPKLDDPALMVALRSQAAYVGALGSDQTTADRRRRLLAAGLEEEKLARLRAPIGIKGLGNSPEEIALGILAQIAATPGIKAGPGGRGGQTAPS